MRRLDVIAKANINLNGDHCPGQFPLGHSKLDTTARYTQVATNIIREVMSPLDRLTPLVPKKDEPPA
jgi:hypothetical protein